MARKPPLPVLAAIDVGTNAVRLKVARPEPTGGLVTILHDRDPIRPGEGVFKRGVMPKAVVDRLVGTMRRYGAICRRQRATVRAVATSAVREAKNKDEIIRRVREEAGVLLEVVSGMEEARLTCLGVLDGTPAGTRSLCLDIGGGSTEIATADGVRPTNLWSVALGAVRLTDVFDASKKISNKQLVLMREYAAEAIEEALPKRIPGTSRVALGSSGTINAVITFAADGGAQATAGELDRAVESLVEMGPEGRRKRFDPRRADIIVAGGVILDALARHLGVETVVGVERGLRDGILTDLLHRGDARPDDHSLGDAAMLIGRKFQFDEHHARQVAKLSLELFDQLAPLHKLPASTRPFLEVAALLHDIGNAVSYQKHHRHTYYLIQNADIPGLPDRERELVARIARYHRRSAPEATHAGMNGLTPTEIRLVRKLSTLLRVADSLDRSHHQTVTRISSQIGKGTVTVRLRKRGPIDLELWDAAHESALFRRVFQKTLVMQGGR